MSLDVVIVSNGVKSEFINMTQQAVMTAREDPAVGRVIVIEGHDGANVGSADYVIGQPDPFNYNQCLNWGWKMTESEYVAFCNNDIIFRENWATNIIETMRDEEIRSASPWCVRTHPKLIGAKPKYPIRGYQVRKIITGWCLVLHNTLYRQIGGFNESVSFWYSDVLYKDQIRAIGEPHMLCPDSEIEHLESKTLNTVKNQGELTRKQEALYKKASEKYKK